MLRMAKTIRNKGFTLVELLVVIAIIAILVSILMPALSKIRKVAKRSVCAANLHRWGVAIVAYVWDGEGKIPESVWYWGEDAMIPNGMWVDSHQGHSAVKDGIWSIALMKEYLVGINYDNHTLERSGLLCPCAPGYSETCRDLWDMYGYIQSSYSYFGQVSKWIDGQTAQGNPRTRDLICDLADEELSDGGKILMSDVLMLETSPGVGWSYNHSTGRASYGNDFFGDGNTVDYGDEEPPITGVNHLYCDLSIRWKDEGKFDKSGMTKTTWGQNKVPWIYFGNGAVVTTY